MRKLFAILCLLLLIDQNRAVGQNYTLPIDVIALRYFNGEVGGGPQKHLLGLQVSASRAATSKRLITEASLSGQTPAYYEVYEFVWFITVENTGPYDVAVFDWAFKAICPEDNMGREWDATSSVNVITPYIPGDIYLVMKPGEKKRFFSGKTDFFWCLPRDKSSLDKRDRFFQALITCAALVPPLVSPPVGKKKQGKFNPPYTPPVQPAKPPLDPELVKLINEHNKAAANGNSAKADELKALLIELVQRSFPERGQEVVKLLKPVWKPTIKPGKPYVTAAPEKATKPVAKPVVAKGAKSNLLFSDWYFMQSDKAVQYSLALVRQVKDTGYLRMRLRINKGDAIWCSNEQCLGYRIFLGYDMPDMATSQQHHYKFYNSYAKPYYELPFDIPVLLRTYEDGSKRYWDTEIRKVMYHVPSNGQKGMVNFLSVCVDDILASSGRHRCTTLFNEAAAQPIE
ncbi:MAG: hypothetical protein JWP69_1323 [Flaviaesturariibacter sp.]|nr:hypothetical protein [Flaviaesturariibacter sp.]